MVRRPFLKLFTLLTYTLFLSSCNAQEITCTQATNYNTSFACSGTTTVKTQAGLDSYHTNYGLSGSTYKALTIDLTEEIPNLVVHSPCIITLKKITGSNAQACIDSNKTVKTALDTLFRFSNIVMNATAQVLIQTGSGIEANKITLISKGSVGKVTTQANTSLKANNLIIDTKTIALAGVIESQTIATTGTKCTLTSTHNSIFASTKTGKCFPTTHPVYQSNFYTKDEDSPNFTLLAPNLISTSGSYQYLPLKSNCEQLGDISVSTTTGETIFTPRSNAHGQCKLMTQFTSSTNSTVHVESFNQITINPIEDAPIASAGLDQLKYIHEFVTIDGSASIDPDGDEITYLWEQISGNPIYLPNPAQAQQTFRIEKNGPPLIFRLHVTDTKSLSQSDIVIDIGTLYMQSINSMTAYHPSESNSYQTLLFNNQLNGKISTWDFNNIENGIYHLYLNYYPRNDFPTDQLYILTDSQRNLTQFRNNHRLITPAQNYLDRSWQFQDEIVIANGNLKIDLYNDTVQDYSGLIQAGNFILKKISPLPENSVHLKIDGFQRLKSDQTNRLTGFDQSDYQTRELMISNLGTSPLTINQLLSSGAITITSGPQESVIAPNQSVSVEVSIRLDQGTSSVGTITFNNDVYPIEVSVSSMIASKIIDLSSPPEELSIAGLGWKKYHDSYINNSLNYPSTDQMKWIFSKIPKGMYQVAVSFPYRHDFSQEAQYEIFSNGLSISTVKVDNSSQPNDFFADNKSWKIIGTFPYVAGTLDVVLKNNAEGIITGSAVRISQTDYLKAGPLLWGREVDGSSLDAINFGQTTLTINKTKQIELINLGSENLIFDLSETIGNYFTNYQVDHQYTLIPNETIRFDLTLDAKEAGPHTGAFTISSNDTKAPIKEITFSGVVGGPMPETISTIFDDNFSFSTDDWSFYFNSLLTHSSNVSKMEWSYIDIPQGLYQIDLSYFHRADFYSDVIVKIFDNDMLISTQHIDQSGDYFDYTVGNDKWKSLLPITIISNKLRVEVEHLPNTMINIKKIKLLQLPNGV